MYIYSHEYTSNKERKDNYPHVLHSHASACEDSLVVHKRCAIAVENSNLCNSIHKLLLLLQIILTLYTLISYCASLELLNCVKLFESELNI